MLVRNTSSEDIGSQYKFGRYWFAIQVRKIWRTWDLSEALRTSELNSYLRNCHREFTTQKKMLMMIKKIKIEEGWDQSVKFFTQEGYFCKILCAGLGLLVLGIMVFCGGCIFYWAVRKYCEYWTKIVKYFKFRVNSYKVLWWDNLWKVFHSVGILQHFWQNWYFSAHGYWVWTKYVKICRYRVKKVNFLRWNPICKDSVDLDVYRVLISSCWIKIERIFIYCGHFRYSAATIGCLDVKMHFDHKRIRGWLLQFWDHFGHSARMNLKLQYDLERMRRCWGQNDLFMSNGPFSVHHVCFSLALDHFALSSSHALVRFGVSFGDANVPVFWCPLLLLQVLSGALPIAADILSFLVLQESLSGISSNTWTANQNIPHFEKPQVRTTNNNNRHLKWRNVKKHERIQVGKYRNMNEFRSCDNEEAREDTDQGRNFVAAIGGRNECVYD
ncbi:hypothetical protein LXL04_009618 [Taraxacum kok-saghyz]